MTTNSDIRSNNCQLMPSKFLNSDTHLHIFGPVRNSYLQVTTPFRLGSCIICMTLNFIIRKLAATWKLQQLFVKGCMICTRSWLDAFKKWNLYLLWTSISPNLVELINQTYLFQSEYLTWKNIAKDWQLVSDEATFYGSAEINQAKPTPKVGVGGMSLERLRE